MLAGATEPGTVAPSRVLIQDHGGYRTLLSPPGSLGGFSLLCPPQREFRECRAYISLPFWVVRT
jgi:hypothetical protein